MGKNKKYILSLDQGTTSSRALLLDERGIILSTSQKEFKQIYPRTAWVEHCPKEIWSSQAGVAAEAIAKLGIEVKEIAAIGITNQRETTIVWDRETGEPVYNAIVWQDRRTASYCDELKTSGYMDLIKSKTGLIIDAYFSATKVRWILENVAGAKEKALAGRLAFGTVDSWLVWKLTSGNVHATDITNASRTMIYNIKEQKWDDELLDLFGIPSSMLPTVKDCSDDYGNTTKSIFGARIPIAGIAGDQQAAMFGQMCTGKGMIKNTYGTGCFITMNIGSEPKESKNNLLTTVAWKIEDNITYAFEGSIFIAGAVVQWLRDGLGFFARSEKVEVLANSVKDNGGVYLVPAFAGLGAPHWDQYARGAIFGITRGTTDGHIARAALESIAYQTKEVLDAMQADSNIQLTELRVDGGASINDDLMQFQAGILDIEVIRPKVLETTAMGAAFFAGLAVGVWKDLEEIKSIWQKDAHFSPQMPKEESERLLKNWHKAVERAKNWEEN